MANGDDGDVLEPEDWFCGLLVLMGGLLQVASSWTADHDVASQLLGNGFLVVVAGVVVWVVVKGGQHFGWWD